MRLGGVLGEGSLGRERGLRLVRGSRGLWRSGRARRTLSSVIHRGGVLQRKCSSAHARSLREGRLRARLKVRRGAAVAVCKVHCLDEKKLGRKGRQGHTEINPAPDTSPKRKDKSHWPLIRSYWVQYVPKLSGEIRVQLAGRRHHFITKRGAASRQSHLLHALAVLASLVNILTPRDIRHTMAWQGTRRISQEFCTDGVGTYAHPLLKLHRCVSTSDSLCQTSGRILCTSYGLQLAAVRCTGWMERGFGPEVVLKRCSIAGRHAPETPAGKGSRACVDIVKGSNWVIR